MKGLQHICVSVIICIVVSLAPLPAASQSAEQGTYLRLVRQGYTLLHQGDPRSARDRFEEALRYWDRDAGAYVGLGVACYHLRDDSAAERALRQALERDPQEKLAWQVLGDLAYRRDDMDEAVTAWERAVELDPDNSALRTRLERLRREHRTEKDFNKEYASHFSIKYEGRELIESGRIVLRTLENAYGDIGRELSYYPDREIAVILYSNKQFQEVTDAPGWSGGMFDGKIRLPIGGIERETPALRAVLYHEYTHAVVRSITPRVPAWLNEGLAQYFEGRKVSDHQHAMLRQALRSGQLPSLRALEGSFMGYSGAQASFAYLQSLSVVNHMIEDYGLYRVRTVLDELGGGSNLDRAVSNGLIVSLEEFERGWRRSLE